MDEEKAIEIGVKIIADTVIALFLLLLFVSAIYTRLQIDARSIYGSNIPPELQALFGEMELRIFATIGADFFSILMLLALFEVDERREEEKRRQQMLTAVIKEEPIIEERRIEIPSGFTIELPESRELEVVFPEKKE